MGTRHIIAVQLDGEYRLAQYGQWDGYPSGQGVKVLDFLHRLTPEKLETFKRKLKKLTWATEQQIEDAWVAAGADRGSEFVSMGISDKLREMYPEVSRDTGAAILDIIMQSQMPEKLLLNNSIEFAKDGLYCEWAYVIDFDKGTFEVYKGFSQEPHAGRFSNGEVDKNGYAPVKLVHEWPLHGLPTQEQFLEAFKADE